MTKEERFTAVMEKLQSAPNVEFNLDAVATFCMVSAMRLSITHPTFKGPVKKIVIAIADKLSEALVREEPSLKEFLDDMVKSEPQIDPASQQTVSE